MVLLVLMCVMCCVMLWWGDVVCECVVGDVWNCVVVVWVVKELEEEMILSDDFKFEEFKFCDIVSLWVT